MFANFAYVSFVTLSLFTTVGLSAPVSATNGTTEATSIDAATLLKNGQTAQAQNAFFQALSANDACTTGETACINAAQAECVDDKWVVTRCPRSLRCYAVPSVREEGTTLTCTSQRSALALINATGAEGGIAVAQAGGANGTTIASASGPEATSPTNATESSIVVDDAPRTVTVTVFPSSSPVPSPPSSSSVAPSNIISTDLPSQTLTVPPAEASAIIASLTASGASIVSVIQPSGAAAAFPADAPGSESKPAATTIKLTAVALPVQTSASASAVTSAAADAGDYGYGY